MAINKFSCDCCGRDHFSHRDDMKDVDCGMCHMPALRRVWTWKKPTTDEELQAIYIANGIEKRENERRA